MQIFSAYWFMITITAYLEDASSKSCRSEGANGHKKGKLWSGSDLLPSTKPSYLLGLLSE